MLFKIIYYFAVILNCLKVFGFYLAINNNEDTITVDKYFKERKNFIEKFEHPLGNLRLNNKEQKVNDILMKWKDQEFEEGFKDPDKFLASKHFFESKPRILDSKVFQILQILPKGASLHSHVTAMVSTDYILKNLTYWDNLYAMVNEGGKFNLKFFKQPPKEDFWRLVAKWRKLDEKFDKKLKQQFTLVKNLTDDDRSSKFSNGYNVWKEFQEIFDLINPLLKYKPILKQYYYQALKEFYDDNIKYLEIRAGLSNLYDLDNIVYDREEYLAVLFTTTNEFIRDYPDFLGVKIIFSRRRTINNKIIEEDIEFIRKMNKKYPRFIVGYDLVGQEDLGLPLKEFVPGLLKMKNYTNLFLHAGETLWNGALTDENLIDAVLLNASRIGHSYAILKHPEVLNLVKKRNIALEICPISNQVLGLVADFRNHPANYLIANNFNIVITPDDPSFWGAKGVSFDWYIVFMGMANKHADLRLLKKFALNSILYSAMDDELKEFAFQRWITDYMEFLTQVIKKFS